jgi:hypothetical protein
MLNEQLGSARPYLNDSGDSQYQGESDKAGRFGNKSRNDEAQAEGMVSSTFCLMKSSY